ncbi:MAG: hypothetical protein IIT37_04155, partial [Bacteroidales bacterium]|nr:hypothetical protein [Bacteroidales bacterium]
MFHYNTQKWLIFNIFFNFNYFLYFHICGDVALECFSTLLLYRCSRFLCQRRCRRQSHRQPDYGNLFAEPLTTAQFALYVPHLALASRTSAATFAIKSTFVRAIFDSIGIRNLLTNS